MGVLTFKAPFTEIMVFAASEDQDQAAQNMQPDLRSTLSNILELYRQKIARNLLLSLPYCRIRYPLGLFEALRVRSYLVTGSSFTYCYCFWNKSSVRKMQKGQSRDVISSITCAEFCSCLFVMCLKVL